MILILRKLLPLVLLISTIAVQAQISLGDALKNISYSSPKEYEIASISFITKDSSVLDQNILRLLTGLQVGQKVMIPGDQISNAITSLWKQGLFTGISVNASKIEADKIFLEVELTERARLSRFRFTGVKKNEADDLREAVRLIRGKPINENLLVTTRQTVLDYFVDKGFMDVEVKVSSQPDTIPGGGELLNIEIQKNRRIKIHKIRINGNEQIADGKLKRKMKNTKENPWWSIFTTSKYMEENFIDDQKKILNLYYDKGYKDVTIVKDTVYRYDKKRINVELTIEEGNRYYFRNISWVGNTKYTSKQLGDILGIKKGDVYNQANLEQNLFMNASESDVSSLYMNDGHLFFQVTPVETFVKGDSVDIEMRIYEGKQARINRVTIVGNDKTNDHVILREIRTRPGQLFRRSDIIRTQRELSQLGYFDPEKMGVNPMPNPQDGTVDIEYQVEEKPSDQLQLSGGWGAGRLIGNLGLAFNNFSASKFFKKSAWRPLPSGDGQRLSINASSTGRAFQSYNLSFTEPWLGGKKPNSLTITAYHSLFGNGAPKNDPNLSLTKNTGIILGYGRRLKWPDDFFTYQASLSYQYYELINSTAFVLSNGFANNFSITNTFSRNSIDQPIYPKSGSNISLSVQVTPPYSILAGIPPEELITDQQKYKWVEFHKWKFDAQWFTPLSKNKNTLVLMTRANFGFLGLYNRNKGLAPFERFRYGGTGLSGLTFGAQFLGAEIVGLRGYDDGSISGQTGSDAPIYNRYTMELRFPISLNPSATVFALAFAEGGNAWSSFNDFNPFNIKRSAGVGVRVFLPMFGLLGLDYGRRFDDIPGYSGMAKGQFHFIIGQNFN
ncbi:MAG: outer membrane protein assembly factor BamA [Bacteroidetes bacterium]|nr:outer membrane protein assembly factor BamA [Bacteroidota bacterium]